MNISIRVVFLLIVLASIFAEDATFPLPNPGPKPIPQQTPLQGTGYQIQPGDVLKVEVFGQVDLSGLVRIPNNGRPAFALIGEVPNVIGLSLTTLCDELTRRYEDGYLVDASLTVSVQEFMPRHAYVIGQVREQGAIELTPFSPVTVLQAISRSGGFLPDADRQNAKLIRSDVDTPGAKLVLPVPGTDLPADLATDIVMQPNDVIVVPLLGGVVVVGKVRQPGAVPLQSQGLLTVTKAIALAGGFEKFARGDIVQLIRSGSPTKVVNAEGLLNGSAKGEDPVLHPGDTIFVPDAKF